MTKEQFDNYKFSIRTEVNYFENIWDTITEVDFENWTVSIKRGQIIDYTEIKKLNN